MLNADLKEFEFTSEFDELVISAVLSVPPGDHYGVVQIVHGMNDHKERWYPFMDYLAEQGFITAITDIRGHGKSICNPDDLGFMFRDGGNGLVSDIAQLNSRIISAYPDLPRFMIANGTGGAAARCFIKEHDSEIDGLVLLGTVSYSPFSHIARAVSGSSQRALGSRYRSEKIYEVIEDTLGRHFGENDNSWRCSVPEVVDEINTDPLCNFKYTLNGYTEMMKLVRSANDKGGWKKTNPSLPIRFISGKDDPCMISEKKFFRNISQLEKLGYESISHRLFDEMRHDVIYEKNSVNVWKDIAKTLFSWVDRWNDGLAPEDIE